MFSTLTHLDHYSIVEQVGAGASSNVYLALEDGKFNSVAIKQLRKTCLSEPFRKLMANEAALGARLQHKNIVRLLGQNLTEESGPYLVLEYIKGAALSEYQHADTLLPIDQVLSIIEQLAQALRYLATQKIVHRDVKPENIIWTPSGLVKLIDFGCAITAGSKGAMVAGSLAYMSPEQLAGEVLDERSDIYSLGAVLYRLLSGKNTFEADNEFDARIAVLNFPALPIERFRQGLPLDLLAIIQRALEKEVNLRYPNWDSFIQDFADVAYQTNMLAADLDLYRGFSPATQSVLTQQLSASRQFTRSGFSRSMLGG